MRVIRQGEKTVIRLLGKQKIKDTQYRLMKYYLKTVCDEGVLLHNVITGKLVLLSEEEMLAISMLPSYPNCGITELIESFFLVPVDYDERDTVTKLRVIIQRLFEADGINGYTILTTTNCNARCFYCYQNGYTHVNMSSEIAEKLADYMISHKGKNPLKLHWFGGEPLVGMNRIDQICKRLRNEGISYTSTMISNGYLFSEEAVQRAVNDWKLLSVQITLDGTEKIYNETKAYVSVHDNPYHRVLRNIALLLDHGIRVLIRLNLDMHNADDLSKLIAEISRRFRNYNNFDIYAHVLFENEGMTPIERTDETRRALFVRMVELNELLEHEGLSNKVLTLPALKIRHCMADRSGTLVVYPNGDLFKCEHIVFEDAIGDLNSGICRNEKAEKYRETTVFEECDACPLFPSCVLLKRCNGLEDYNLYTCRFRRESFQRSMIRHYEANRLSNDMRTQERLNSDYEICS